MEQFRSFEGRTVWGALQNYGDRDNVQKTQELIFLLETGNLYYIDLKDNLIFFSLFCDILRREFDRINSIKITTHMEAIIYGRKLDCLDYVLTRLAESSDDDPE